MSTLSRIAFPVNRRRAFTLLELLVAMTVLVLLIGLMSQMTTGVSNIINRNEGHIDADRQARALLDRMAIDFGAMVKRSDVDYYLKGRPMELTQVGNDQIAFYSEVPGYFPSTTGVAAQSPVSVVAYRVNSATLHLERLSKGVAWNGTSTGSASMGFLPVPLAAPLPPPSPLPSPASTPVLIPPLFPQAANTTEEEGKRDPDYEELSPQIFRFEYYYLLKGQNATGGASILSTTPWYVGAPMNHTQVNGMQDVAGIGVLIAVIDPKSRLLVSDNQLIKLATQMDDAIPGAGDPAFKTPGDIESHWLSAVSKSGLPRPVINGIRIYTRCFYLNGVTP